MCSVESDLDWLGVHPDIAGRIWLVVAGFDAGRCCPLELPGVVALIVADRRDRDQADQVNTGSPAQAAAGLGELSVVV